MIGKQGAYAVRLDTPITEEALRKFALVVSEALTRLSKEISDTTQTVAANSAKTAGTTRTRGMSHLDAKLRLYHRCIMGKIAIELRNHARRCTLLRTEYRRGSGRPPKWIRHIGGTQDARVCDARVKPRHIHRGKSIKKTATAGNGIAVFVKEADAQCLCHACTAIIRG